MKTQPSSETGQGVHRNVKKWHQQQGRCNSGACSSTGVRAVIQNGINVWIAVWVCAVSNKIDTAEHRVDGPEGNEDVEMIYADVDAVGYSIDEGHHAPGHVEVEIGSIVNLFGLHQRE